MGMDGGGLSIADAMALQDKNGNGMFGEGGGGMMMMFLFFILALGGNGFGGFGGNRNNEGACVTKSDMCNEFNFNNLERAVDRVGQGLCDGFYAQNTTMLQGFNGIGNAICNLGFQAQQCCCETNRNIDAIRYENAKNTCDIVNAIRCDGDATRALMTQNTIQDLRDRLQDEKLSNSQCAQNAYLINQLQPCARPAYITCSPYTTNNCGNFGNCGGCAC